MRKQLLLTALFIFSCFLGFAQKLPSADAIIARYVKMIGGEKWSTIKTSEFHGTATVGDKKLKITVVKAGPGKYYQSLEGEGLSIIEIYDSGKAIVLQNGKPINITDTVMLDHYELQSHILPDISYKQLGYKRQLLGMQNINEEPCYKISLTSKNGSVNLNYYEKKSGLLIAIDKSGQRSLLTDYKPYKGYSIPYTISSEMGSGNALTTRVDEWLINDKGSLALFNAKKQEAGF